MDSADALADAHERFGDIDEIRMACLDAEDDHPLRLAGRVALRVGMLGVGFGAIALAFALVQSVLLQPLRFDDADRLVRFGEGWDNARVKASTFVEWRDRSSSFDDLVALDATEYTLTGRDFPLRTRAMRIGDRYFELFSVDPVLGRTFTSDEVEGTPGSVVLLSEALWESRYRRSPTILGRQIVLNGQEHTVVGVMPEQGQLSHVVDLWVPLPIDEADAQATVYTVGRLRDGISLDQARAEIDAITEHLAVPDLAASTTPFNPLQDLYATPVRSTILLLLVVSTLILILVWATVFQRAFDRSPLGRAAGAATSKQAWMEAFAMAGVAAVLGGGLAVGVHRLTYDALSERGGDLFAPPGLAVVGVVLVLAVATAVGLVAAQQMASWREAARPWRQWMEHGLVVGSTAAMVVLLVVVVQQHREVWSEPRVASGLDDQGLYVASLTLAGDLTIESANTRMEEVLGRVREVPGVETAEVGWAVPFHREERLLRHEVLLLPDSRRMVTALELVGADYLRTIGANLVEGRNATTSTPDTPAREVVISEAFAAHAWPGGAALGKAIDIDADGIVRTVVGVVEDVPYATLRPDMPVAYIPYTEFGLGQAALVVRAPEGGTSGLKSAVRRAVYQADPSVAVEPLVAVRDARARAGRSTTTRLGLLAGMAGIGLVCVMLGVIHLIFGWERHRVLWDNADGVEVWRRGLGAVALGLALGVAVAAVATRELAWLGGGVDGVTVGVAALGTGAILVVTRWVAAMRVPRSA
ncbi:MAG: ABC transporter permease [Rubricoccaceae bacterium]